MDRKTSYPVNANSCYRLFMEVAVVLLQRVEEFLNENRANIEYFNKNPFSPDPDGAHDIPFDMKSGIFLSKGNKPTNVRKKTKTRKASMTIMSAHHGQLACSLLLMKSAWCNCFFHIALFWQMMGADLLETGGKCWVQGNQRMILPQGKIVDFPLPLNVGGKAM
jgi:hypothetical protein